MPADGTLAAYSPRHRHVTLAARKRSLHQFFGQHSVKGYSGPSQVSAVNTKPVASFHAMKRGTSANARSRCSGLSGSNLVRIRKSPSGARTRARPRGRHARSPNRAPNPLALNPARVSRRQPRSGDHFCYYILHLKSPFRPRGFSMCGILDFCTKGADQRSCAVASAIEKSCRRCGRAGSSQSDPSLPRASCFRCDAQHRARAMIW
jgi:hypothetical protein